MNDTVLIAGAGHAGADPAGDRARVATDLLVGDRRRLHRHGIVSREDRSSGAGGQHVNVTDSAIRITHLPTGLVVSCQNERSQHRNRDSAMRVLKSRLFDIKMRENQAKLDQIGGAKKDIAFGSQIRSYVLHPYQMVKDHRTRFQVGDVSRVLDGDLDDFIKAYLMKRALGKLEIPTDDED